jgi:SPP1 family predicted phage head-tail adaptor
MQIGQLNKRIQLQLPTRVSDGMGGFEISFSTVATVWAKKWTVSSSELMADMKVNMVRVQKFCIRYRSVLLPSWRIKYGTTFYNITGIDPDEKNEFIYLTVKESV